MSEIINAASNETSAPATEPKLTPRERLMQKYNKLAAKATDLSTEITKVVAEIAEIDALDSIDVGAAVFVTMGKGEEAREVPATVIAVKLDDDGSKVYKVQYGTGFDADITVVRAGKIKLPGLVATTPEAHGYPE